MFYSDAFSGWIVGQLQYIHVSALPTCSNIIRRQSGSTGPDNMCNLRTVQRLLDRKKVDRTVRYLGVELEDDLNITERIDI